MLSSIWMKNIETAGEESAKWRAPIGAHVKKSARPWNRCVYQRAAARWELAQVANETAPKRCGSRFAVDYEVAVSDMLRRYARCALAALAAALVGGL